MLRLSSAVPALFLFVLLAGHNGHAAARSVQSVCGQASWYGPGFDGRMTASGATFNQNAMTAAHKSLPFGTRIRVEGSNGRSVVVTINDRGPYVRGRLIDLSSAAAEKLQMKGAGVIRVCFAVIG